MILQESCNIDVRAANKEPDREWMAENVPVFEKIFYLGHFLFDTVQAISGEKFANGSTDILIENDLITFAETKEWDKFIYSLCYHFLEDGRNSIIDTNLQDDFNRRIKTELGLDLTNIGGTLAYLNNELQNRNPPMLCTLAEFINLLKENSKSPDIEPFINGLILNRDNVTSIKMGAISPYTGNRILHKPILTFNLDGTPCILTEQYSFMEALNTFFQNGITLGKIPAEWEDIQFMKAICKDYKAHHKNILEDPVEESLKSNEIKYIRNVKTLYGSDGNDLSINDTPGEIDFIFLLNKKIYIADCKNLTKRYEIHGYYQDISKFKDKYNPKMKEKLTFFNNQRAKLEDNLRVCLKLPDLDLSAFKIEGIFIINTPTLYALNGDYKTYTFHRFNQLLAGKDFFNSYMDWPEGVGTHKIKWPFIDNLKKVIAGM
jgi:hypothetical protein